MAASNAPPTLLDEFAKFLGCTNEQVRFRLHCPKTHARVVDHFKQRMLLTIYKDRTGQCHSLIFDGLTRSGADKLFAHGNLRYPFNSKLPQYFYDRHNIQLKFPYHPAVIYTNHGHQNHEFYPLELVRLLQKMPPIPQSADEQQQQQQPEEHIYATPFEHIKKRQQSSRSSSSMSTSTSSYQASLARSIADAEERQQQQQQQRAPPLDLILCGHGQQEEEGDMEMRYIDRPPSSDARHFVHWTRLRNGRWCAKKVWIKEYPNPICFEAEIAKIASSSH